MSNTGRSPFDDASREYLESTIFTEGADLDRLEDWLGNANCVLDVGAGTLHTAGRLKQAGVSYVAALDPSLAMLREGMGRYRSVQPIGGSAEALPVKSNVFDGLVCRYAAHHFEAPEVFLGEAKRVLEPAGTFAFQDLVIEADDELGRRINEIAGLRDPSHERYRSPDQWGELLEESGFEVMALERFKLPLDYEDWIDRSDPPADSRETIKGLFAKFSEAQRRRINLTMTENRPESFEYSVAIVRCRPSR